jgi:hypothetical protein
MKAYGKSRSTALFIVNRGSRWRAAVNFTSLLLYPWERNNLQCALNMLDEHQSLWMCYRKKERKKKEKKTLPYRV